MDTMLAGFGILITIGYVLAIGCSVLLITSNVLRWFERRG